MKSTVTTTTSITKPVDNEPKPTHATIDPTKTYQYTWPGQKPAKCNGATLLLLLKGASFDALGISEVVDDEPAVEAPKVDAPKFEAPKAEDEPRATDTGKGAK